MHHVVLPVRTLDPPAPDPGPLVVSGTPQPDLCPTQEKKQQDLDTARVYEEGYGRFQVITAGCDPQYKDDNNHHLQEERER